MRPLLLPPGPGYSGGVTQQRPEQREFQRATRPLLRGVFHQYAFFVSLGACGTLLLAASPGPELFATAIYAAGLCGVLGASALYHRIDWSPRQLIWMRRLDHAMIFVLIAGTYTPFSILVLNHPVGSSTLELIWLAALVGAGLKWAWIQAPDWVAAVIYVAVGAMILPSLPALLEALGPLPVALVAVGGAIYIAGALIFALGRPNPVPELFGYHEIFHLCVIAAATLHFTVIAYWIIL